MKYISIASLLAFILLAACSKTPDHVISESKMADLMTDMQIAEAVADINRQEYLTDSAKLQLKRSVLAAHNVSEEQFDTSLVWYGHNLDIYKKVYDQVIKNLEERQKVLVAEAKSAGEKLTLSGDSIDIWESGKCLIFDKKRMGETAQINFSMPADENTKIGDKFEWRFMLRNATGNGEAMLAVNYADGSFDYSRKDIRPDETTTIKIQTDSTIAVTRIFGFMIYKMGDEDATFADSLTLYRSRLDSEHYVRFGSRRNIQKAAPIIEKSDTTAKDVPSEERSEEVAKPVIKKEDLINPRKTGKIRDKSLTPIKRIK